MPRYNLLEYFDNYADSSGSLWQFKRDEQNITAAGILNGVTTDNSSSFKYKSRFLEELIATDFAAVGDVAAHRILHNAIIAVPLKYLFNFFRSLEMEMPLINCKIHQSPNWTKNCVTPSIVGVTRFKITSTKLYVQLSLYQLKIKSKIETKARNTANDQNPRRFPLDASFQGVNRLFVLAFDNTDGNANQVERNSHGKYFPQRVDITKYNVLIDGRNFYNQPISDEIKKYDEIRKIATGKRDDYTKES